MIQKQGFLKDILHIFVLTNFALAEPVVYLLSRRTVFLLDQGIEFAAILTFVVTVSVFGPLLLVLAEWIASRWGEVARERTYVAVLFILFLLLVLPVLKLIKLFNGMMQVALSLALAALAVYAYRRFVVARHLVTAAAPAILVFPGLFFFFSPVTRLLFPAAPSEPVRFEVRNAAPVVLVVFDEFCGTSLMNEQHEIDAARYPNFAALARDSTWYRNASSVHLRTEKVLPAILTGKYPPPNFSVPPARQPENLFTLMLATDYELTVFEPYSRLFPKREEPAALERRNFLQQMNSLLAVLPFVYLSHVFPVDLPIALPDVPRAWFGIKPPRVEDANRRTGVFRSNWDERRDEQFHEFLDCIIPSDQPSLYFSHVVVPHFPWCYLPSGRRYSADRAPRVSLYGISGQNSEDWGTDELAAAHGYQRYLLQVGYVDQLVGDLLAKLRETGLYDRCLLVVMSDHGVSFRPSMSRRLPTDVSLPDILSVPLFIKRPNQNEGRIDDRMVESIDVLPTIVDLLGLEATFGLDGHSLLDELRPERSHRLFQGERGPVRLNNSFESKYETLDRMLNIFGSGKEPDRLFTIGPRPELIGRELTDLQVIDRSEVEVEIKFPRWLTGDEWKEIVPCYFDGRVRVKPATKLPVELAIAVNGTIRATTRTYLDSKIRDIWTAMVPESSLRDGDNEVQVFVVNSTAGKLTLASATDEPHVVEYRH